jgi:cobalamin biosynthesis protein CobW
MTRSRNDRKNLSLAFTEEREPPGPLPNPPPQVFGDQLAWADLVILNKTDLIDAETLRRLRRRLMQLLRPGMRVVPSRNTAAVPNVAMGLAAAAEDDLATRPSLHDGADEHDHDDFDSFVVTLGSIDDAPALVGRPRAAIAAHGILIVKGFVNVENRERRQVVQAAGPRGEHYYDRAWQPGETRTSRLVVIGEKGLDGAAVTAALGG